MVAWMTARRPATTRPPASIFSPATDTQLDVHNILLPLHLCLPLLSSSHGPPHSLHLYMYPQLHCCPVAPPPPSSITAVNLLSSLASVLHNHKPHWYHFILALLYNAHAITHILFTHSACTINHHPTRQHGCVSWTTSSTNRTCSDSTL